MPNDLERCSVCDAAIPDVNVTFCSICKGATCPNCIYGFDRICENCAIEVFDEIDLAEEADDAPAEEDDDRTKST